jgi:hypothetical protein
MIDCVGAAMAYPRALPAASKQFKPPRRFSGRSDGIPFTPNFAS